MTTFRRIAATVLCGLGVLAADTARAQFQKTVFIEDFSSVTCVNCPQATAIINKIAQENPERVLTTQWHLDIPGRNDPFFTANKLENLGRSSYYGGFNSLPQVYVSGTISVGTNEATVRADLAAELAETAPIGMTVTQEQVGNTMNVQVSVEAPEGLELGHRLYVIAVEGMVHRPREYFLAANSQPYYEETEFRDLFRIFVNPLEGEELVMDAAETRTFNYSYSLKEDWDPEEMYVIAWVQDEFTYEAVQAASSPKPPSLGVDTENADMAGYAMGTPSPNPANEAIRVALTLGNPEEVTVTLHNVKGEEAKKVLLGRMEAGEHKIEIETTGLPTGAYTLTMQAGQYRTTQKVRVVR